MNQPLTSNSSIRFNFFKDINALTFIECRCNILFLKYLSYKEKNVEIKQKYNNYIRQLTNRLLELKENK